MSLVPHDYTLPESDDALLSECDVQTFRGHGPGGQSVNTADSAVRLIHRPTGIVVVCREERSQLRNKQACLRRLRERVAAAQRPVPVRVATRPTQAARARRLAQKSRLSAKKAARRPPSEDG